MGLQLKKAAADHRGRAEAFIGLGRQADFNAAFCAARRFPKFFGSTGSFAN
jgi:hypothetical protein